LHCLILDNFMLYWYCNVTGLSFCYLMLYWNLEA
jgi:hypothetical protein